MRKLLIIAALVSPFAVNSIAKAQDDAAGTKKTSKHSKKTKKNMDGSKTTTEKTETKTEKPADAPPAATP